MRKRKKFIKRRTQDSQSSVNNKLSTLCAIKAYLLGINLQNGLIYSLLLTNAGQPGPIDRPAIQSVYP